MSPPPPPRAHWKPICVLSDRVFVMSQRPGTIIEQIDIDLPLRENPMARRHDLQKEVGEYVAQLMTLLNVDELAIQEEV